MRKNWKRKIPLVILLAIGGIAAFSGLVMLLWNNILPGVLHVGAITFWQAAGILVLARLLFGGLKGRRHRMMGGCRSRNAEWQNKWNCQPQPAAGE